MSLIAVAAIVLALAAIEGAVGVLGATWMVRQVRLQVSELAAVAGGRSPALGVGPRPRVVAVVAFALGCIFFSPVIGLFAALVGPSAFLKVAKSRRQSRNRAIEREMPALLRSLSDGVAAGMGVAEAAAVVAAGAEGEASRLLGGFARDVKHGGGLDRSLARLVERGESVHLESLATVIELHRRTGGDLPGSIVAVAEGLEDVARDRDEARSTTAQARFTAVVILGLVGVGLIGGLVVAPESLAAVAGSPIPLAMSVGAVVLQAGGLIVIRRLGAVSAQ
jgi:tight adherence protein B